MPPPPTNTVKMTLRATHVAGAGLGDRALGAAGYLDVARSHDADGGRANRLRRDASRTGNRDVRGLDLDAFGVDVARAGDVEIRALGFPTASLDAAGAGDGQLQGLDIERGDVEAAGPGNHAFKA